MREEVKVSSVVLINYYESFTEIQKRFESYKVLV